MATDCIWIQDVNWKYLNAWIIHISRVLIGALTGDASWSYFSCGCTCGFSSVAWPSSRDRCCSSSTVVWGCAGVFSLKGWVSGSWDWCWLSRWTEVSDLYWTCSPPEVTVSWFTEWDNWTAGLKFVFMSFVGDLRINFGAGLFESYPWGSTGPPNVSTRDIYDIQAF